MLHLVRLRRRQSADHPVRRGLDSDSMAKPGRPPAHRELRTRCRRDFCGLGRFRPSENGQSWLAVSQIQSAQWPTEASGDGACAAQASHLSVARRHWRERLPQASSVLRRCPGPQPAHVICRSGGRGRVRPRARGGIEGEPRQGNSGVSASFPQPCRSASGGDGHLPSSLGVYRAPLGFPIQRRWVFKHSLESHPSLSQPSASPYF